MATVVAAYAEDGMLIAQTGAESPFTLLIANGERDRTVKRNGQIVIVADTQLFQQMLIPVGEFLPQPPAPGDTHAVLSAYADWAMKAQNELTSQNLKATVEFVKLGETEWAYFHYDLAGYIKEQEAAGKVKPGESTAVTQHIAATVLGQNVLMLSTTEMQGDGAEPIRKSLFANATSLKRYDKQLTREDIIAICKGIKK